MTPAKLGGLTRASMSNAVHDASISGGKIIYTVLSCTIPCHKCQLKSLKVNPQIGPPRKDNLLILLTKKSISLCSARIWAYFFMDPTIIV